MRSQTEEAGQVDLFRPRLGLENPEYLSRQLITYIGNKRALLRHIEDAVSKVRARLGKRRLRFFDVFSGSGVVSRLLKQHSSYLVSNDIEDYAAVVSRCYLSNSSDINFPALSEVVAELNSTVLSQTLPISFIRELYAPRNDEKITKNDRVFYTAENARRLDDYRRLIDAAPARFRNLLLGPLISKASVHSNTAGIFKGFYKNRHTGVGQFGGTGVDALSRIKGKIDLELPVLSRFECEHEVLQEDANAAVKSVKGLDLAYIDPPYNQHPYGSNYFMLNLLVNYRRPARISRVSGIPTDWKRSDYNVRAKARSGFEGLVDAVDAKFLLVSFNNEGFIRPEQMRSMLFRHGPVETFEVRYNAFRGSRSFANRSIHVKEQLFLVEKR